MTDSLLRLQEKKYVDSPVGDRPPSPTNGGPQPRLSSPPSGILDLDDPGAQVAEHHRGVRAGERAREVDDDDPVERTGRRSGVLGRWLHGRQRKGVAPVDRTAGR